MSRLTNLQRQLNDCETDRSILVEKIKILKKIKSISRGTIINVSIEFKEVDLSKMCLTGEFDSKKLRKAILKILEERLKE